MLTNKDVIVVAPNQYKDLARKLSHEISKKGGFNGACWTIKDYEDNEYQVGSVCPVILLGNADENKLTKDYLPLVGDQLLNRAGACFGYDGSKAVIFGEGKLEQVEDFQKLFKELLSTRPTAVMLAQFTILAAILGPVGIPIAALQTALARVFYKTLDNRAKKQKLLRHQTEVAVTLFLTDKFDQMVGIKKTD